jgi:cytoskeleton protein RodZ
MGTRTWPTCLTKRFYFSHRRNDDSHVQANRVSVGAFASDKLAGMGTVLHQRRSTLAQSRSMMSSALEQDLDAPQAPRAGADLRTARERVGWSLSQMADALRIRYQYLEALEDGRINELPGNAYALGFMRTYATALGLDPNEIARRFRAEAAEVNQQTVLTFPVPVPARGVPAGAVVLLGVVLAVGVYVGWYRLSGEGRLPAETSAPIPAQLAPLAQQAVPPSTAVAAQAPATQLAGPATQSAQQQAVAAADQPPAGAAAAAPPVPAISPTQAAAAPAPATFTPPLTDQARIVLRASADAWVQVRDRSGTILLNRILHAGDAWEVPPKPNLLLTTGNAGGTDLMVDGSLTPSLGGNGAVRRDVPLDPDLLKDGKVATANSPVMSAKSSTQ